MTQFETNAADDQEGQVSQEILIPKIIHRIWLGDKPLPAEFERFGRSWSEHHPDWEMRLWTSDNMPRLTNQYAFDETIAWSGKSNILRYELLLRYGGVYIDTDVECLRSIEPLLRGVQAFAGYEDHRYVCNAVMGATPNHLLFQQLVQKVPESMLQYPAFGVYSTKQTGPPFLTRQLSIVLQKLPRSVKLFPPGVFYPYHASEPERRWEPFPDAFAVHHWNGSWMN